MKTSKKHIEAIDSVPDRSTLEISIEQIDGQPPNFRFRGGITDSAGNETPITKTQAFPGPFVQPLRSPRAYLVAMAVAFNAAAKVRLIAKVIHPDGTVDPDSKQWVLSGSTGTEIRRLFVRCA